MSASKDKNWLSGKVVWFDYLSGEGMVTTEHGEIFYVHYSAIESNQKRKSLKKGQDVKFKVFVDIHFSQVEKIKTVE